MNQDARIFVAGHAGFVGSAICRRLARGGYTSVLTRDRASLDLRNQADVFDFFERHRPEFVFLAAARVGGILANDTYPAEFIVENLSITTNVIEAAHRFGVGKLLFLGSACAYPRMAPQPIREEYLLTGPLEPTNAPFAVAKIAGISMCEAYARQYGRKFFSVMPANLYGPGDNFDLASSHVVPALMRKYDEARRQQTPSVTVWGTGKPLREFLFVDDLADACVFLMEHYEKTELVNIGFGSDISVRELTREIASLTGYSGITHFDTAKPDGTPRKLLDCSRLTRLGWEPRTPLADGLRRTYEWFLQRVRPGEEVVDRAAEAVAQPAR